MSLDALIYRRKRLRQVRQGKVTNSLCLPAEIINNQ